MSEGTAPGSLPALDAPDFVRDQLEILRRERRAEQEEAARLLKELDPKALERRGLCLRRMVVREQRGALGGRTGWVLGPTTPGPLPPHRFSAGDVVRLVRAAEGEAVAQGVVERVRPEWLVVVVDDEADEPPSVPLRVERLANEITWNRLERAVRDVGELRGRALELRAVLLGARPAEFAAEEEPSFFSTALDDSQRAAVRFALSAQDVALIHGPPGTGKTTTLVEVVRQCVARGERVLATAASNVAVDNLLERLVAADVPCVRLGHPARVLDSVASHTLDAQVERAESTAHAAAARRDLAKVQVEIGRTRGEERRALFDERRRLRAEVRDLERAAVQEVLAQASVVLATHVGCAERTVRERDFDTVVIDEAAQALEASCWIPLVRGRRLLLAGDHRQLPPVLRAPEHSDPSAAPATLFERLLSLHGESVARMLTVQYRMHEQVMGFSSGHFYGGLLEAAPAVAAHVLADLDGVRDEELTRTPLQYVDTAGCDLDESEDEDGESRANPGEAKRVAARVRALLAAGVAAEDIGVITPYNAQVALLRLSLGGDHPRLEIGSVDGFQGREKEAVVVSLVRSNRRGELGFLTDDRRTNVAFTRARRHLSVFGDSATLGRHPLFASFLEHCEAHGAWRSAFEWWED